MAQGRLRGVLQADGPPLVVWVRSGSVSDALGLLGHELRARGVPLRATAAARQRRRVGAVRRLPEPTCCSSNARGVASTAITRRRRHPPAVDFERRCAIASTCAASSPTSIRPGASSSSRTTRPASS